MYVSYLAGLGNASPMAEALPSIIGDGINCIIGESAVHQKAGDARASATFTRIAIYKHYVILFFVKKTVHLLAHFE